MCNVKGQPVGLNNHYHMYITFKSTFRQHYCSLTSSEIRNIICLNIVIDTKSQCCHKFIKLSNFNIRQTEKHHFPS